MQFPTVRVAEVTQAGVEADDLPRVLLAEACLRHRAARALVGHHPF